MTEHLIQQETTIQEPRRLLVATHNRHKVQELRQLLGDLPLKCYSLSDLGWKEEIEENGTTFCENACLKREALAARYPDCLILADDSGLCVDALRGAPGIHTARYGGPGATQQDQFNLLWSELAMAGVPERDWSAQFVCCLALYIPGIHPRRIEFEGRCPGRILPACVGEGGFGYDPIFYCDAAQAPMATLSEIEKNRFSHRGKAVQALRTFLYSALPGASYTLRTLCEQSPHDEALRYLRGHRPDWQDDPIRAYTVAYLRHPEEERSLFLYRNKKERDINRNKYIGVGGKVEPGESCEEANAREIFEETGIQVRQSTFQGLVLYADVAAQSSQEWMVMAVYSVEEWESDCPIDQLSERDCSEGTLHWLSWKEFLAVPHWVGDEPWLRQVLVSQRPFMCWASVYQGDKLLCESAFAGEEGEP